MLSWIPQTREYQVEIEIGIINIHRGHVYSRVQQNLAHIESMILDSVYHLNYGSLIKAFSLYDPVWHNFRMQKFILPNSIAKANKIIGTETRYFVKNASEGKSVIDASNTSSSSLK